MDKNEVFAILTANSWCNKNEQQNSPFLWYFEYEFKANGEYRQYGLWDAGSNTHIGKWNLEKNFDDDG